MGRSTVTGKLQGSKLRTAGFTLLELMIVISIIIILASITLPQYQKTIMHTRETVLRDDLRKMRSLIDQFAADKGRSASVARRNRERRLHARSSG